MKSNITGTFEEEKLVLISETLRSEGFDFVDGRDVIFSAKQEGCTVHLYKTHKVLFQGRNAESIANVLVQKELIHLLETKGKGRLATSSSLTNLLLPRIGSDESGKGDYFGPLVTAAVFVDDRTQILFEDIGVQDSKNITDRAIRELAPQISRATVAISVPIGPDRYNQLYRQMRSVNKVLGWAHARAIENVLEKKSASVAVADQFGNESSIVRALLEKGKKIELRQMPKAEADLAVAAASIIARDEFLIRLERLSASVGMRLPKGASSGVIEVAVEFVKRHGFERLGEVAKMHFKTTAQVRDAFALSIR